MKKIILLAAFILQAPLCAHGAGQMQWPPRYDRFLFGVDYYPET